MKQIKYTIGGAFTLLGLTALYTLGDWDKVSAGTWITILVIGAFCGAMADIHESKSRKL